MGEAERAEGARGEAVAIEFAFLLPSRRAAQLRMQAARLLVRYLGGDLSRSHSSDTCSRRNSGAPASCLSWASTSVEPAGASAT